MRHTWVERRGARQDGGCFSAAALSAGKLSVWLLWLYLVSAMNYKWSCGVSRLTDDSGYTVGYSDWANSGIKQRKDIWDGFIPTLILRHGLMCSKCETVWGFFSLQFNKRGKWDSFHQIRLIGAANQTAVTDRNEVKANKNIIIRNIRGRYS